MRIVRNPRRTSNFLLRFERGQRMSYQASLRFVWLNLITFRKSILSAITRNLKNFWIRQVAYRCSGKAWFDRLELTLFGKSPEAREWMLRRAEHRSVVSRIEQVPELYFIHIPKNGGTSFSAMVEKYVPLIRLRRPWDLRPQKINGQAGSNFALTTMHMSPDSLVLAALVSPGELISWNSVALIRDPLDRFVSLFKYHRQTGVIGADTTINQYFERVSKLHRSVDSLGHHSFHGLRQTLPQSFWLKPKLWPGPKTVLRLEEISADNSKLTELFGTKVSLKSLKTSSDILGVWETSNIQSGLCTRIMELYSEDYEFIG
jgi:hypothetical protein